MEPAAGSTPPNGSAPATPGTPAPLFSGGPRVDSLSYERKSMPRCRCLPAVEGWGLATHTCVVEIPAPDVSLTRKVRHPHPACACPRTCPIPSCNARFSPPRLPPWDWEAHYGRRISLRDTTFLFGVRAVYFLIVSERLIVEVFARRWFCCVYF